MLFKINSALRRLLTSPACSGDQLPRWRHPLVGYLVSLLLVGSGLGVALVETYLVSPFSFPGTFLLFAVVFIALFWGLGPALFAILLSLLVLDTLYIPPFGILDGYRWDSIIQLLTFAAGGIIIALLAQQREAARLRAVTAERDAMLYARQLEATFNAMKDGVVVYNQNRQVVQTNAATRHLLGMSTPPKNDQWQKEQDLLLQAGQQDELGHQLPEKRQPLSRLLSDDMLMGTETTDVLVRTLDGREVVLNMSGAPIRGGTGTIEYAVLIYRDVTIRRQLEQQTAQTLQAVLAMAQVLVEFPERLRQKAAGSSFTEIIAYVGQQFAELTTSIIEKRHVIILAIEPEEDAISPAASVGFTPHQEYQLKEHLTRSSSLLHHVGNEEWISQLKANEVLVLDGTNVPLYTHVLPYDVQAVLIAPICVGDSLVGLLCVDDGSSESAYTPSEMRLVQTIAGLMALLLAQVHLQREHTEALANELALREANQRMEAFLGIICHELKTPLTVMGGCLQLVERRIKHIFSPEALLHEELRRLASVQDLLGHAKSQITLQNRLVDDLLDVSRIQAHTLRLFMALCNLVSIVQETVEDQRLLAAPRIIRLDLPTEQEVPVSVDADRLVQVVTNYLTNALKYSPADQPVEVRLSIAEQFAQVSVQDKGPGLSSAEQERIWERFYRVPGIEVQSGTGVGLGVGLYLCRTIIEQHGGQVGVQSVPGQGSTFWFTLPLTQQKDSDKGKTVW
jgi:K+-sensing histidine kinase KdpD